MRILYVSKLPSWDEFRETISKLDCLEYMKKSVLLKDYTSYRWIDVDADTECMLCGESADRLIIGDLHGLRWVCDNQEDISCHMR